MLRTSIRAPIPFHAGVHKEGSVLTDFLIMLTNMDRKSIAEPALLRGVLELRGCPMVARGGPREAK